MTRAGVQIGQQGVDVKTAPDYQKVLDSDFPTLEIFAIVDVNFTLDMPAAGNNRLYNIYDHKLGYMPAFEWFSSDNTSIIGGDFEKYSYLIGADETSVYVVTTGTSAPPKTLSVKGKLIIYSRDLKEEFLSASTGANTVAQRKSPYGFRNLKDGKRIDSVEYSDFSVNTQAKMMNIHMSGTKKVDASSNYEAYIEHRLSYLPSHLAYLIVDKDITVSDINTKNGIAYQIGPGYGEFYHGLEPPFRAYGDSISLKFTGVQSVIVGIIAYIIFKDPITGDL